MCQMNTLQYDVKGHDAESHAGCGDLTGSTCSVVPSGLEVTVTPSGFCCTLVPATHEAL